jgi:hypothetical protein
VVRLIRWRAGLSETHLRYAELFAAAAQPGTDMDIDETKIAIAGGAAAEAAPIFRPRSARRS